MRLFFIILVGFISLETQAQYPFERYKKIEFEDINFRRDSIGPDTSIYSASYGDYRITLQENDSSGISEITLFKSTNLLRQFKEDLGSLALAPPEKMQVADINGDGFTDFKFTVMNTGSGLAGSVETKVYLFGSAKGFSKVSYSDFFSFPEVDMDRDGNFEIIGCYLAHHNNHSYWTFNLYNYRNGRLINVNRRFHYPIMIQYLDRENYTITKKISRTKMKEFSKAQPGY